MPVSDALKRLLRIRDLEQEQHRAALSSALAELHSLEDALSAAHLRERAARNEFQSGIRSGEFLTRHAALIETVIGEQHRAALVPVLTRAEDEAARRRRAFLHKRMERRQAETLITEAAAADAIEAARQSQQRLDDWHLARTRRTPRSSAEALENPDHTTAPVEESSNPPGAPALQIKAVQE